MDRSMKRMMCVLGAGLALAGCQAVRAEGENVQLVVRPPAGKICHADGTVMTRGEMVFVWTAAGTTFAGLKTDFTPVDGATAVTLDRISVTNGAFRTFSASFSPERWGRRAGEIRLLTCDTRRFGGELKDCSSVVQAFGEAAVCSAAAGGRATTRVASPASYAASAVAADVPQPRITGIRIEGDDVVLSVAGTSPDLNYDVAAGASPSACARKNRARQPKAGCATGTIELRVDRAADGGSRFFRVVRHDAATPPTL